MISARSGALWITGALWLAAATGTLGCESRVSLGGDCSADTDCQPPFVCGVGGRCRVECTTSEDCSAGERCLVDVSVGVRACSIARETCETDCAAGLQCVADECQSGCTSSAQCPDSVCTVEGYCLPTTASVADAGTPDASTDPAEDAPTDTGTDAGDTCAVGPGVVDVAVGATETCAVTSDHYVYCWGYYPLIADAGTGVDCYHGPGNCHPRPVRIDGLENVEEIVLTGRSIACVRLTGGEVHCWGDAAGVIDRTVRRITSSADGSPISATRLVAGDQHVCALETSGRVSCWGRRSLGCLGDGGDDDAWIESATPATELGPVDDAEGTLATGYEATVALGDDGQIRGVGANESGQLGATPSARSLTGVPLPRSGATHLAASGSNTCVLVAGQPRCWGHANALLGASPTDLEDCFMRGTERCTPVRQALTSPMPLAQLAGDTTGDSMYGITSDGIVFGWGSSDTRLLSAQNVRIPTPLEALGGRRAHVVSVRGGTACAILDAGAELVCWGLDSDAQLGRGVPHPRGDEDPSLAVAQPPCW
ncbi:MAG: hypothetical protein J0L92_07890 [Deltaproteobacteria bacterium]|nr:hypothetical protein [Deltaproteobacteria bacterium]